MLLKTNNSQQKHRANSAEFGPECHYPFHKALTTALTDKTDQQQASKIGG